MSDDPTSDVRLLAPAQVGEVLGVSVDEVMALVNEGRLRGLRVGAPARWRIDAVSVGDYLDDQAEEARRMALWRQSQNASFPELWGGRIVRHPD
jgi:excisionase family DNA binding protein